MKDLYLQLEHKILKNLLHSGISGFIGNVSRKAKVKCKVTFAKNFPRISMESAFE